MRAWSAILNKLFPPKCIFCNEILDGGDFCVCPKCAEEIPYNTMKCRICGSAIDAVYGDRLCKRCRKVKRPFVKGFVPLLYDGEVSRAVKRFKFYGRRAYAKTFAVFIFLELRSSEYIPDIVTFVPIHFIRHGARGYNQSQLIARELAGILKVPCLNAMKKTRYTLPLSRVKFSKRAELVKGAFEIRKNIDIKGKRVLLTDDILTTGTTVSECARVLRKAGCAEISVAAIATVK